MLPTTYRNMKKSSQPSNRQTVVAYRQLFKLQILLISTPLLISFVFSPTRSQSQNTQYLYVQPNEKDAEPSQTSPPFTRHSGLNTVFAVHGVTKYIQSFPGAKTPVVKNTFEIHLTGDINAAVSALDSLDLFDDISIADYYQIDCDNPAPPVNDTYIQQGWTNNYALEMIEANCAWSITTGNPNVTVAVVDTYFDLTHEDMSNNFYSSWGNGLVNNCSYHGIGVAGIVAAETNNNVGIASIGHSIKVAAYSVPTGASGGPCSGNPWPGIWQAYIDGHQVINVSWSGTGGPTAAVQEMTENGVVLVVSAGNTPNANHHNSYANIPGVINVSGVENNNMHGPTGHAHNANVDLCAPSLNVTTLNTNNGYHGGWGTSFAAPLVSGTIGLMLSVNPCLTPSDVENILKLTADPIADAASFPNLLGAGRLNAYQAVLMAEQYGFQGNVLVNTVWDTPTLVTGDVLIQPGVTLTITDLVNIAGGAKISVMPNATLIVDGGTLTNSSGCGNAVWAGIEVHGNTNQHQNSHSGGQYHQGRAIFKNGAVIENAWQGVMNWKPNDWNSRGGIIQATNSTFRNNRIDAIFMAYQNFYPSYPNINKPEESFFRECNFILDNDYLDDPNLLPPRPRITIWNIDRLRIQGCNFTNTQTVDASENRGHAIYSHNANYLVTEYCPGIVYPCPEQNNVLNTFTGWHKAIEAVGTASSRPITVRNSVFDKNMIGVELGGADYSQVYKNNFNVGGHGFETWDGLNPEDNRNHLGIFANETYHFSIEENILSRPAQGAPFEGHGVLVFNSRGANNVVYKNTLNNLKTGINGWQVNLNTNTEGGATFGQSGLQFTCNLNTHNEVDFKMSRSEDPFDQSAHPNSGIRLRQGSASPPRSASNTFSTGDPDPLVFTHFMINSDHNYFYWSNGNLPSPSETGPGILQPFTSTAINNCPGNYTTGEQTVLTGKTQLLQKIAEYEGMVYAYNQLIDDGNTPATITEVELTWPQQAWQLRDQLMQRAPYNSEEVLIAAIVRNIMPHAMLLEVLLANPDALLSGNVIRHAETIPNPPMPQYMTDLLWDARNQTTLRTGMESALAELHADVEHTLKIILAEKAFADSTSGAPDSTLYYLGKVKTVEGNYSRAAALADRHLYSQAITLLDSMQTNYKLSTGRYAEMAALKDLYGLLASAHSSGKTVANLDSTALAALKTVAENPTAGIAAKEARNALCFHYQICYPPQGQPKSNALPRKPQATYKELVAKINTVTAYPNPSDQYITIAYTLLHAKEETTLLVYDVLGRQTESRQLGETYEGQQLLDTRKMPDGVYFYQVVQEGKKVSEGKFVVIH